MKLPALPPAEGAGWAPQADAGSFFWVDVEVTFAEADSLADYAAFKKAQGIVIAASGMNEAVYLPTPGKARMTHWRNVPR